MHSEIGRDSAGTEGTGENRFSSQKGLYCLFGCSMKVREPRQGGWWQALEQQEDSAVVLQIERIVWI